MFKGQDIILKKELVVGVVECVLRWKDFDEYIVGLGLGSRDLTADLDIS